MLIKNKIRIIQRFYRDNNGQLQNEYHLVGDNGFYLGMLKFPTDIQVTEDLIALEIITSALAQRWHVIPYKKKQQR